MLSNSRTILLPMFGLFCTVALLTVPSSGERQVAAQEAGKPFHLVQVTVNIGRYWRVKDKNEKDPPQIYKGNPKTIEFTVDQPTYKLSGAFTIEVPTVLANAKEFNARYLAVGTWDLKNAGGSVQVQAGGPGIGKSEQLRSDTKPLPAGRHTLTIDEKPKSPLTSSGVIRHNQAKGVNYYDFGYSARFNTGNQFDSVLVEVNYTYTDDPKLAGGGTATQGKPEELEGLWHNKGQSEIRFTKTGDSYSGRYVKVRPESREYGFTEGEENFRNVTRTGPNTFKGELKLRYKDGRAAEWRAATLTINGDHLKVSFDSTNVSNAEFDWYRGAATGGDCPPTLAGRWGGNRSGVFEFTVNGNAVTGTAENLDGKHGRATITGTLQGTGMTGTWKAANASGTITVTHSSNPCMITADYKVVDPPGMGSSTETITRPGSGGAGSGGSGAGGSGAGGTQRPWETAEGRDCFEKWIALATNMLNKYDGGAEHNGRKPWSFNKYGLLEATGIKSAFAPDNFESKYQNNKYWFMWDQYETDAQGRFINSEKLTSAGVPPLRDYVLRCAPGSAGPTIPAEGMVLIAPELYVPRGAEVLAMVRILRARDLWNMDFQLSFQNNIVTGRPPAASGAAVLDTFQSNLERPDNFKFAFASLNAFNGDGSVAGFRFSAVGLGRSPLTLTVDNVRNSRKERMPISLVHGFIAVYDPNDPNDPNRPPNSGGGPGGGGTGGGGTNQRQPTCSGTGVQTMNDAICCLKIYVGLTPSQPQMDVNGDGVINSSDAVQIMENLRNTLPQRNP